MSSLHIFDRDTHQLKVTLQIVNEVKLQTKMISVTKINYSFEFLACFKIVSPWIIKFFSMQIRILLQN